MSSYGVMESSQLHYCHFNCSRAQWLETSSLCKERAQVFKIRKKANMLYAGKLKRSGLELLNYTELHSWALF